MRLTIINQFYPPDISPTAQLTASLAAHRAGLGDSVTVVASQGYVSQSDSETHIKSDQLRIRRIWTPKLGKRTLIHRFLDYVVFYFSALWVVVRLPRQDVVICLTTPPFIVSLGVLHKLIHRRTKLVLWNMDCYPEVAERVGIIREKGVISPILRLLNRFLWTRIDHIVCLDKPMKSILNHRNRSHVVPTSIIPNWEPLSEFPRKVFEICADTGRDLFTILYSGNLGHGHSIDTLIEAGQELQQKNSRIRFLVTGGGAGMRDLERKIKVRKLTSFELLGYVRKGQLRQIQQDADCALITLRDEMLGIMSPSKLHANLAMGQPVIYVGPQGSNVDEAITKYQCGLSLRNGDVAGLVNAINTMAASPSLQQSYAQSARCAFEDKYCDLKTLPLFDATIDLPHSVFID